jgi:hypothetical protein
MFDSVPARLQESTLPTAERKEPNRAPQRAEVAELADAHGSGPCARKGVGVRVPSSAPIVAEAKQKFIQQKRLR